MAFRFPYDSILVITQSEEQSVIVDAICFSLFPCTKESHHCRRPVILDVRHENLVAIVMGLVNLHVGLPRMTLIIAHDVSTEERVNTTDLLQKPDFIRTPYPP
jgi:hypothetical protein